MVHSINRLGVLAWGEHPDIAIKNIKDNYDLYIERLKKWLRCSNERVSVNSTRKRFKRNPISPFIGCLNVSMKIQQRKKVKFLEDKLTRA
jgi:hypothetical protein